MTDVCSTALLAEASIKMVRAAASLCSCHMLHAQAARHGQKACACSWRPRVEVEILPDTAHAAEAAAELCTGQIST